MKNFLTVFAVFFLALSTFGQTKQAVKTPTKPQTGMVSINGKNFGPQELNGKVVVLNFWFTSCPPCLKEIPELNKLVEEYKGKDVVFLGLATDDKQTIEEFLKEKPFKYEIIPSATQLMFRFLQPDEKGKLETKFPTHIVVDRTGKKTVYETGIKGIAVIKTELEKQFKETKPIKN